MKKILTALLIIMGWQFIIYGNLFVFNIDSNYKAPELGFEMKYYDKVSNNGVGVRTGHVYSNRTFKKRGSFAGISIYNRESILLIDYKEMTGYKNYIDLKFSFNSNVLGLNIYPYVGASIPITKDKSQDINSFKPVVGVVFPLSLTLEN